MNDDDVSVSDGWRLPRRLTQREVADLAGVEVRTVRRWVASGLLKQETPKGTRIARYRLEEVERFLRGEAE
jgi:excisionase family DNA binding protein